MDTARLQPGQIRLSVERFALTTNNITYAVAGDMLDYWGFFPVEPGADDTRWGRIPAMGLGLGRRVWSPRHRRRRPVLRVLPDGFRRLSSTPPRTAAPSAIVGPHRANHAATYTDFRDVTTDVQCSARTRPTSTSCCGACS